MLKEMPKAKIKSYKNSNSKQDLTCASSTQFSSLLGLLEPWRWLSGGRSLPQSPTWRKALPKLLSDLHRRAMHGFTTQAAPKLSIPLLTKPLKCRGLHLKLAFWAGCNVCTLQNQLPALWADTEDFWPWPASMLDTSSVTVNSRLLLLPCAPAWLANKTSLKNIDKNIGVLFTAILKLLILLEASFLPSFLSAGITDRSHYTGTLHRWRDSSAVKSKYCSYRGPKLSSQLSCQADHSCLLTPAPRDLLTLGTCTHVHIPT